MAYRAAEALGLAVLLACCLLLAVPAAAHAALSSCYSGGDTSWYDDSKTTFTLDSANELAGLAQLVTLEGKTFRGKTVKIGRDMDLSSVTGGKSWLPIGHSAHGSALFQGTFDGQGHILKNLRVDCDMYEVALFGGTRDATIRNFTLTGTVKGTVDVAGVVAVCSNTNLEDIVCDVDVTAEDDYNGRAGGVVGYAMTTQDSHNTYRNLVNKGTVSGHGAKVGGVFGFLGTTGSATVVQCANTGNVTSQVTFGKSNQTDASYGVGGVIGSTTGEYGSFTIAECFNSGKVSSNYMQSIGGIAGYLGGMSTSLTSCYNDGQVSGSKNAGGIAGYFGSQGGTLSATYNKGKVSGSQVGGTLGNASNAGQTLAHNFSHDVLSGDAARAYGDSVQASNAGTSLSTDQIRSQNLLDLLNGYGDFFDWDDPTKTDDPANDGYLYLKWQNLQKGRPNGNPGGNEDGSGESDGDGDKPGDGIPDKYQVVVN
ncbi:MAG: hypothetical protein Q4D06_09865, partial [Coriobacteriia bacterium]|nr:hypothetical protein [Coriobacteriia bacterium]